jgi:hypothetical protein
MRSSASRKPGAHSLSGITARSVILGLVLTLVHTVWLIYEELTLAHIGTPSIFTLVQTVIGILFVMMVVNVGLRRWRPEWMFGPGDFMVVFVMTTLGSIITSVKLLHYLFPTALWPSYMAAQCGGPETAASMSPLIAPRDPALVSMFFAGTRDRWAFYRPEVLGRWLVPMAFWGIFFFLLLWTMLCLASMVRRPWLDQERLPFPIIDLPTMMARTGDAGSLLSNRLLTLGFGLTGLLLSMNYISSLVPAFPGIRLAETDIGTTYITSPPWTALNPLLMVWWPFAIGLCYLIPLDVGFSCWFFFLFLRLLTVWLTAMGWRDAGSVQDVNQFPYLGNAAEGAWLGMFAVVAWNGRRFIGEAIHAMRRHRPVPGDDEEAMPFRWALLGALAGYGLLVACGVALGLRPAVSLLTFALYFVAIIVMTRMWAQIAMPLFCMAFFSFTSWTTSFIGTDRLSRTEAATLTTFYWFDRTYEQLPMGHYLEGFALADRLRQSKRSMFRIALSTSALCILIGMMTLLQIFYDRGAASARVSGDTAWLAGYAWSRFTNWISSPQPVEAAPLTRAAVSAIVVLLLSYARGIWIGFPFHPIGYLFTVCYALEWGMWNVIFVTWLIKWLVVRYGGLRLYRTSVNFFLGMALGDCVAHFVWGIGLSLAGATGASPY